MKSNKQGITSAQFRQAAKDLNLTVTTVAEKTGLSKAYVSEFRNETRNLSISQQSSLRTYLEGEYEAQGLEFPEDEGTDNASDLGKELGKMVQQISRPAIMISEDLPKAQVDELIDLIDGNRIRIKEILAMQLEKGGIFSMRDST
jgi:transcriptional regulator with XRE-family HTH domain